MQQPTCRAQAASDENDLAGNTRCFTEGTKEQKYGTHVYYFFPVSMAQRVRKSSLNLTASKPCELAILAELNFAQAINKLFYLLVNISNEVRTNLRSPPFDVEEWLIISLPPAIPLLGEKNFSNAEHVANPMSSH